MKLMHPKPQSDPIRLSGIFGISLRVKGVRFHRPTIRRIFAAVTSPGMPSTWPLRISATRR
jgi:hypothetical protein